MASRPLPPPTPDALFIPPRSNSRERSPPSSRPPPSPSPTATTAASIPSPAPLSPSPDEGSSLQTPTLAIPPTPLATPTPARKPPLSRTSQGVKKRRNPRSPNPNPNQLPTPSPSPSPLPTGKCKSLRKSTKQQPFLRLIDNLSKVFAASSAPVTAKTKKERNAAHAKKSDVKNQKYVEALEKLAVEFAAAPKGSKSPYDRVPKPTSPSPKSPGPASSNKKSDEPDNLSEKYTNKPKIPELKPPSCAFAKTKTHDSSQRKCNQTNIPNCNTKTEVSLNSVNMNSAVSDAMFTSSGTGTNATQVCPCADFCKPDATKDDVCLCDLAPGVRRIICEVFPFAKNIDPKLAEGFGPSGEKNTAIYKPDSSGALCKNRKDSNVTPSKPEPEANVKTEGNQPDQAMLKSIPSLQRQISLTPSSKEFDNIPSISQIIAAGVSTAMETPPGYKHKHSIFAETASSGGMSGSFSKSGNMLISDGIGGDLLLNSGEARREEDEEASYSPKKQAQYVAAKPSPDTVQATFVQDDISKNSVTPALYLSPNRWDFSGPGIQVDVPMLAASNESGLSLLMRRTPGEETELFSNWLPGRAGDDNVWER